MLFASLTTSCVALALLTGSVSALDLAPTLTSPSLLKRASAQTTLAPGTSFIAGQITPNFRWQASGILARSTGGCPAQIGLKMNGDCYGMYLAKQGMLESDNDASSRRSVISDAADLAAKYDDELDAYFVAFPEQAAFRYSRPRGVTNTLSKRQCVSTTVSTETTTVTTTVTTTAPTATATVTPMERQRIEMLSWPGALAGETWLYQWKSWQAPGLTVSFQFHHAWQLLRRDGAGGPVITLGYNRMPKDSPNFDAAGYAVISDPLRGCANCASVLLKNWWGKTITHRMTVTYGPNGSFLYSAADVTAPRTALLRYGSKGQMGSSGSIKFGMYRRVVEGLSESGGFMGDYSAIRLA